MIGNSSANPGGQAKSLDATRRLRLGPGVLVASLILAAAASSVQAENWPQWRGPRYNGVSHETNIPGRWSRTENVAWRLALPGRAGATPIVWGDRIFLTSALGDRNGADLVLICASTSGKELWRRTVATGDHGLRGDEGNLASPSPTTDGKHIWTFMGTGDLACYDFDGNEVWKFNMQQRYGRFDIQFGMSSTPVLDGDRLFLQVIHGPMRREGQPAYVVALDKSTGREIWKRDRKTGARVESKHSYASPTLYDDGTRKFLLTHGSDYVIAHRLSDGSEIWRCGGMNPFPQTTSSASTQSARSGSSGFVARFDSNKDGKVTRSEIPEGQRRRVFDRLIKQRNLDPDKTYTVAELRAAIGLSQPRRSNRRRPSSDSYHPTLRFVSSPAVAPGIIVVPSAKRGPVLALRPDMEGDATGSQMWMLPRGTPDIPSPLIHGGLVYLCSENGNLACHDAQTGEQLYYERTHRMRHRASPVYADGKIYLTARDGRISVVKAGRQFEMLAQIEMEETTTASPVISNGTLYLRTWDALWAIR